MKILNPNTAEFICQTICFFFSCVTGYFDIESGTGVDQRGQVAEIIPNFYKSFINVRIFDSDFRPFIAKFSINSDLQGRQTPARLA